ncbi:MAG TPA: ABC transporter permease subunit, partial [Amycolatopsis sp.]|nr:ABC transporter permease subunit [Amycolatopsis sp.]
VRRTGHVDAARGSGYRERQIMFGIELPLALPVILAGARVTFLQLIATVAIGAIVDDGGGLGRYIVEGFALGRRGYGEVLAGGVAVIVLALLCEAAFTVITRLAVPKGLHAQHARQPQVL